MASDEEDERPERDAAIQAKQGIGLLWRAARGAARGLRRELDDSKFGRTLDDAARTVGDAGQELVRAAENVAGRVGSELQKAGFEVERRLRDAHRSRGRSDEPPSSPGSEAQGSTKSDPGFRIATKEDEGSRKDGDDGDEG